MSPTFAHSSKSVYLIPISHSNKFHNFFNDNINLRCIARMVVNVPDLVKKTVVVDTVIDLFLTVLDSLVEE